MAQSCPTLCGPTRLLCPWNFPVKAIEVGCHFLLQGTFLTQGLNPCFFHLLHWQVGPLPPAMCSQPYSILVHSLLSLALREIYTKYFLDPSFGFPGGSDGKESVCNAGDPPLVPELGRCPGKGNGYPLQHSCLESHG